MCPFLLIIISVWLNCFELTHQITYQNHYVLQKSNDTMKLDCRNCFRKHFPFFNFKQQRIEVVVCLMKK